MNRLVTAACVTLLLAAACNAQEVSQTRNSTMSVQDFHQVLVDLGTYLDAHRGTHLAEQFAAIPDKSLETILPAVADPVGLQRAVSALKESDIVEGGRLASRMATPRAQIAVNRRSTSIEQGVRSNGK